MRISHLTRFVGGFGTAFVLVAVLAGCGSDQRSASEMTSYSAKESKSGTPELFTIPQEQMSHIQVVTLQPVKLTRVLRLTGAVAFNAFSTTPRDHAGGRAREPDSCSPG